MGKAARNRARRGVTDERSAYVAVRREMEWAREHSNGEMNLRTVLATLMCLQASSLRIVQFPAGQAGAFRSYGDELRDAAATARPPFALTFYDFGFLRVGGYEIAGASVAAVEEKWDAMVHLRLCGSNDWTTAVASSESVGTTRSPTARVQFIGPSEGRPPADDATLAAMLIVCGALTFLESANVELVESEGPGVGHIAQGVPHYEVVVRSNTKRYVLPDDHEAGDTDWSHRWEVRGHFKHFRRGAVFENNPHRRLGEAGEEFVRIWCPPHVKGPDDKPFIPKVRRVLVG